MTSRRTVILIVAVVLGAFAALGLLSYVRNAETAGGAGGTAVEVWVAKAPIPKGTPVELAIEQNLLGVEQIAQRLRPATAVVDPATELAGLVAVADLPTNLTLVTGSFVSPSVAKTGIGDRLAERGLVTVTISVDQVRGAAYLIEPGDYVNLMSERAWATAFYEADPPVAVSESATAELAAQLEETDSTRPILNDVFPVDTRMVYQKAEVLAVGDELIPDLGETAAATDEESLEQEGQEARGIITLAVPPEAAQVILNVGRDNIYLSLVPDDYVPRAIIPLDPTTQVLPGEVDGRLTPYDAESATGDSSGLAFGDATDRIGSTVSSSPAAGSGDATTTTAPPAPEVPGSTTETTTSSTTDTIASSQGDDQ